MKDPRKLFPGLKFFQNSLVETINNTYFLFQSSSGKKLGILGDASGFEGDQQNELLICPLTGRNSATLREHLPWLRPQCLGLRKSFGCGDRLGVATPGHVRAFWKYKNFAPIFAQQSMRENTRTGRSPSDVIDDAMWGLFQEGWRLPWGADADHLKTQMDVQRCISAGYKFFTVDCGDHVDNAATLDSQYVLKNKFELLPWEDLEDRPKDLFSRYLTHTFFMEGFNIKFGEMVLLAAACKYAQVIRHAVSLYRYLMSKIDQKDFEFEISIDETYTPTTIAEHYYIANELKRLGVKWVSMAPRYIGRFEKGVDDIGDLDTFSDLFSKHIAIAQALGPYKLSLHSGSDKYRIYPIVAKTAGELFHIKTSGTSYLETLRIISRKSRSLFRDIVRFAYERFAEDSSNYIISTDLDHEYQIDDLLDRDLDKELDTFSGRQVMHVTYGSVLDRFGSEIKTILDNNEEIYYQVLEEHFCKHLAAFAD
jgi:hypothetical protein